MFGRLMGSACAVVLASALVAGGAQAQVEESEGLQGGPPYWPQFMGGAENGGTTEIEHELLAASFSSFKIEWKTFVEGEVYASPVVRGSTIVIGSNTGQLTAADLETGEVRWQRQIGLNSKLSTAAFGAQGVFVAAADGNLYSLDSSSGDIQWATNIGNRIVFNKSASPTVFANMVYVGSADGKVYAVDAASGQVVWASDTGAVVTSKPAVHGNRVLVGTRTGHLLALNRLDGSTVWATELTNGAIDAAPAVDRQTVHISHTDGVSALSVRTGEVLWTAPGTTTVSSAAVAGGRVIVGRGPSVLAYNADSGEILWATTLPGGAFSASPAIVNDLVLIGTVLGASGINDPTSFVALDARTGEILDDINLTTSITNRQPGGGIFSSAAVADGRMCIATATIRTQQSFVTCLTG